MAQPNVPVSKAGHDVFVRKVFLAGRTHNHVVLLLDHTFSAEIRHSSTCTSSGRIP
jgi:hypothetical protein